MIGLLVIAALSLGLVFLLGVWVGDRRKGGPPDSEGGPR